MSCIFLKHPQARQAEVTSGLHCQVHMVSVHQINGRYHVFGLVSHGHQICRKYSMFVFSVQWSVDSWDVCLCSALRCKSRCVDKDTACVTASSKSKSSLCAHLARNDIQNCVSFWLYFRLQRVVHFPPFFPALVTAPIHSTPSLDVCLREEEVL